jgi:uncharacterized protein
LFGRFLVAALLVIETGSISQKAVGIKEDLTLIVQSHRPRALPLPAVDTPPRPSGGIATELRPAALQLIGFYQKFISSQDGQVCNFTVTCSRFAALAVRRYGLADGLAMTSDRIQRCNGIARASYPVDSKTGLAIDFPIERYHLGRLSPSK